MQMIEYISNIAIVRLYSDNSESHTLHQAKIQQLANDIDDIENNDKAKVIIIIGDEKAFAMGIDLHTLEKEDFKTAYIRNLFNNEWDRLNRCRLPTIAAVSGYVLGGGLELAMMCDMILSSDNAQFGQPEIALGLIPGLGATQKLPRIVGTQRAMEICLTGRFLSAQEALEYGIIMEVIPHNKLYDRAIELANMIAAKPILSIKIIKELINLSNEISLSAGIKMERDMFYSILSDTTHINEIKDFFIHKRKKT